ncbi:right-handed parallel beta-helix repeat-containing protein [Demequina muriae]|uniref:Right-handed parallel beta-helix repeat-containing protein n=1 Tax=Demequina muriae TaxID=3051664 RepID=A0ABT8GJ36_9MICO|nr:right-handed parallel beta-helix repeat-containing protein [Demequina sp. EGI L300058]MDN4481453.1 right-handed parallel beta-helix repeat-containing protein [Demequina sp. EGI L300058]
MASTPVAGTRVTRRTAVTLAAAASVTILIVLAGVSIVGGDRGPDSTAIGASAGVVVAPRTDVFGQALPGDLPEARVAEAIESCPAATVTVTDADALARELDDASAGTVIWLEDGTYEGEFTIDVSGEAGRPIWLCGSQAAVLVGEGHVGGYGLHLDHVSHVRLHGFGVTRSQKGVMVDGGDRVVIELLTVHDIGDEAIHLRAHTQDSVVRGNSISDTGNRREKFGEGVYVGSAESNWCSVTSCLPDRSDRNLVEGNVIFDVTAEAVDVKEGTTGGTVRGNAFDGSSLTEDGADSWVDIKGNAWRIVGNAGAHSSQDGFQVHQILDGWGRGNVFERNSARVVGPGFGFSITPEQDNVVGCSNEVTEAQEGHSNVACR